ncbi:MAG: hypothetical protein PVI26_02050 [Chitinispirillia bacterium]
MKNFNPTYKYNVHPTKGIQVLIDEDVGNFNSHLLNIGDLKAPSQSIEVLSVVFDLEGFTNFIKQVDPQLTIPYFISDFFNWLFQSIIESLIDQDQNNTLWAELPFFSKFLGDGVLFLWKIDLHKIFSLNKFIDSDRLHEHLHRFLCNIIASLYNFSNRYPDFLKKSKSKFVDPPSRLRCGIARGSVYPIGYGKDYIGPCINIASRLQNFHNLSFVFSARGIDPNGFNIAFEQIFIQKLISIRGIGKGELVYIVKEEFNKLSGEEKTHFRDI